MNKTRARLAERRRQLVAQAAAQRATLAAAVQPWRAPLALADRGLAAVRYVRRHPVLTAGVALLLATLRTRSRGAWLQRGWLLWQLGRRLRG